MSDDELRPVCFMVMPFRKRRVTGPTREGAPGEVDFDGLWDKAYRPAISDAGFTPVRADFDTGSVIIKDMLERLAYADLVLADVTLPNGNVYYEVGLRQVAKETGCVLFAADWSNQLFDIDQFRSVRYPLLTGTVSDDAAVSLQATIRQAIAAHKDTRTPWHEFIDQKNNEQARRGVFREFAETFSAFQERARAVRLSPKRQRPELAGALLRDYQSAATRIPEVATELLLLVRDELDWEQTLSFCDTLPPAFQRIALVREQRLLALAKTGRAVQAVASLERLIGEQGETPERLGLIGGRYKSMWRDEREARVKAGASRPSSDELRYLDEAIDHYERGMLLDYNEYYCSSNIAGLLLSRGKDADAQRARLVDQMVIAACERAIALDQDDGWTRATLLGAAFRAADVPKARELSERVKREGVTAWGLKSTLDDLKDSVARVRTTPTGTELQQILDDLSALIADAD